MKRAVITIIILSILIYGIVYEMADKIVDVFNSEQNILLQKTAVDGLKIYFISCPFLGCNILLSGYFSAIDKSVASGLISILRGFIVILPCAILLSIWGGIQGLWFSVPTTESLVLLLAVGILCRRNKKYN